MRAVLTLPTLLTLWQYFLRQWPCEVLLQASPHIFAKPLAGILGPTISPDSRRLRGRLGVTLLSFDVVLSAAVGVTGVWVTGVGAADGTTAREDGGGELCTRRREDQYDGWIIPLPFIY